MGHHDVSQDTAFWQATLPIYETYFPVTAVGERHVSAQEVLCRSDAFDHLREVRHAWDKIYHGADYLKLLHTFSDHRALPEPDKTQFFRAIEEVIHAFGGVVHRKYETVLLLARKTREG